MGRLKAVILVNRRSRDARRTVQKIKSSARLRLASNRPETVTGKPVDSEEFAATTSANRSV
jgi:hypothetical protein